MPQTGHTVGIDLGTTNSVISVFEGGEPSIIANAEGSRTTPSVVGFAKNGEVLVGEQAKRQATTNPNRTITSVKRHMGEDWNVDIDKKTYTPQEVSARILQKLKRDAEAYLGQDVTDAVITVPAYFGDSARQATKEAGTIAGLNVLRVVNEPTAAALAYGLENGNETKDEKILVFDLGGGTFDVSVLEMDDGVFEVLSTAGDTHLGGDDFDNAITSWLVESFKSQHGVDLSNDSMAMTRLKESAEKAKIELSSVSETEINLPFITANAEGPIHLLETLTRSTFDQMTEELVSRCESPFIKAVEDAGIATNDLDEILLVGGSTRIPAVRELVEKLANQKPSQGVNPDEVVALGAAIQGGVLAGNVSGILLLDVTPLTLGIETNGGVMTEMIARNTTIPAKRSEIFTTAADNQPEVEIVVAQGERPMIMDNTKLGQFNLKGIAPAQRGTPQIEVTFDIDANGIVAVTAKDLGTGKTQQVTITGGAALSQDKIDSMVRDAESHANEDADRKASADARNKGEHIMYQSKQQLSQFESQIDDAISSSIRSDMAKLQTLLDSPASTPQELDAASVQLTTSLSSIGEAMYASNDATESGAEDDVVEAEIVEDEDVVNF